MSMIIRKSKILGYTLVETMLSAGILAFILLCTYGILNLGNRISLIDGTLLEMEQQSRNALQRMVKEMRQASTQTIVVNNVNSDTITFTIPSATNVSYYTSGTDLIREYPSGTTKKVASNIAYLKFTLNNKVLTINVRADKSLYSQTISYPLTQELRLRNE